MTLRDHTALARARLVAAGIPAGEAVRDAMLLARHALGWDPAVWLTRQIDVAPPDFGVAFGHLVARRVAREPVAYIRGVQEFWGREFVVTPAVLIPRPETELIIEQALAHLRSSAESGKRQAVIDVGTGSGCLAVTMAAEWPGARLAATDISAGALGVARANAARHGVADRIDFREGSYLAGAPGPFDLILSNPPYVTDSDYPGLAPEVRHEPSTALVAGPDGLECIRGLLREAPAGLARGGLLLMEIGFGQSAAVQSLIETSGGWRLRQLCDDLQGIPRLAVAERK